MAQIAAQHPVPRRDQLEQIELGRRRGERMLSHRERSVCGGNALARATFRPALRTGWGLVLTRHSGVGEPTSIPCRRKAVTPTTTACGTTFSAAAASTCSDLSTSAVT